MITLYRSNYDEFNTDKNGGDITSKQIESAVLHSFIPRVRPRTCELGGERYFKFFVKTSRDIVSLGVDIAKFTDSNDDEVYIALETKDDHSDFESDLDKDNLRFFGGFKVVDIDVDNLQIIADRDVSDFVKSDDWITFYDSDINRITAMEVDSVDEDKITLKNWSDKTIEIGNTASSSILIENLSAGNYVGFWIKQTIKQYAAGMENPPNNYILNVWYDFK